jgi:hypothetical protein
MIQRNGYQCAIEVLSEAQESHCSRTQSIVRNMRIVGTAEDFLGNQTVHKD